MELRRKEILFYSILILNSDMIPYAAERSPEKYGKFTVGSWIQ